MYVSVNSLRPSNAYMRQWTRSSLVQKMACRLVDAKPLSEPMLADCQLETSVNLWSKLRHFRSRKCIWKRLLWNGCHCVSPSMFSFLGSQKKCPALPSPPRVNHRTTFEWIREKYGHNIKRTHITHKTKTPTMSCSSMGISVGEKTACRLLWSRFILETVAGLPEVIMFANVLLLVVIHCGIMYIGIRTDILAWYTSSHHYQTAKLSLVSHWLYHIALFH